MKNKIIEKIKLAQELKVQNEEFFRAELKGKNEFIFFIKPEITIKQDSIKIDAIIDVILEKINAFGLHIASARILSADYLSKYNIIAQHYGVINSISNDARKNLSQGAKEKFNEIYKKNFNQCEVFGSLEFIKEFNEFTPLTLDYLWQNKKFEKLAGGTYCFDLNFNGREIYLINGFHPRQLDHFTRTGRSIVCFTLTGELDWNIARNDFIGATNPASANKGSLRNIFLNNMKEYGLPSISSSWNGVHLSAGPIEGLVELIRYNSDYSTKNIKNYADYNTGKELSKLFPEKTITDILSNINVNAEAKQISVFDLTEEKNSDVALDLLKKYIH